MNLKSITSSALTINISMGGIIPCLARALEYGFLLFDLPLIAARQHVTMGMAQINYS